MWDEIDGDEEGGDGEGEGGGGDVQGGSSVARHFGAARPQQ